MKITGTLWILLLLLLLCCSNIVVVDSIESFQDLTKFCNKSSSCSCCGWCGSRDELMTIRGAHGNRTGKCPVCGTYERHRAACNSLAHDEIIIRSLKQEQRIFRLLHFGPNNQMSRYVDSVHGIDGIELDKFEKGYTYPGAMYADVLNLSFPNNFAHGAMIFHVLEHVDIVLTAFQELYRVLKPKAWVLVSVPCFHSATKTSIDCRQMSPSGRFKNCGQNDHVWVYNCNEFQAIAKTAGFTCQKATQGRFPEKDHMLVCSKQ